MNFGEDDTTLWFVLLASAFAIVAGTLFYSGRRENAAKWVKRNLGYPDDAAEREVEKQMSMVSIAFIVMGAVGGLLILFVTVPARLFG